MNKIEYEYPQQYVWDGYAYNWKRMSADEYLEKLAWFLNQIPRFKEEKSNRFQEYGSYLETWFSNRPCEGSDSVSERIRYRRLPMALNEFLQG